MRRDYMRLARQQLTIDWEFGELGPHLGPRLEEDLDLRIDELLVLEHLHARLGAGIAEGRAHHERAAGGAGLQRLPASDRVTDERFRISTTHLLSARH